MQAPAEQIKIRSSYNLAAMSFTNRNKQRSRNTFLNSRLPEPDFRQKIADSLLVLMTTKPERLGMET
jgi:hypothetical protein